MKLSMTFAGVDKATKVMRKIMSAEKKMAAASRAGNAKSQRAAAKTERTLSRTERTMRSLSRGARRSFNAMVAGAKRAGRAVTELHRKSVALGKSGFAMMGDGARRATRGVTLATGILVAAYGSAAVAAGGLIGTAADFEKFQTILEATEGSAAKAEQAMAWVQNFAVTTPYELDQVTEGFVQLRAYGLDPTNGLLKTLGDTSAAMGKPLMQSVEAIADAVTGENERLKEFGIKASKTGGMITYEYTNAAGKAMQASVKANDRMAIQLQLMAIMNEKYAGSMDRLSKTWSGMVSNLADIWTKFQMMIMDAGLFDWMKGKLEGILATLNKMEADGTLQEWASKIGTYIQNALVNIWNFAVGVYNVISTVTGYLQTAAEYVGGWERLAAILAGFVFGPTLVATAAGLVQVASGLAALTAAMMANPILLVIALVAGGVFLIYRNWDKIAPYFERLWASVKSAISTVWGWIKTAFEWSPLGLLISNWSKIKVALVSPVETAQAAIKVAWGAIKAIFAGDWLPDFSAWDASLGKLGKIDWSNLVDREALKMAWAMVTTWMTGVFDQVWDLLPKIEWGALINLEGIKAAWTEITGWLSETAKGLWDLIPEMPEFKMPAWLGGGDEISDPKTLLAAADAAQRLEQQYPKLTAAAQGALAGTQSAISSIHSLLSGTDFTSRGVALMETLAAGIRAGTHHVVAATAAATQQIRDHLPSSPAKTGPLSDIHKLKFGETIAGSIRAAPMIKAMSAAAEATMNAAMPDSRQVALSAAAVPSPAARSELPSAGQARSMQSRAVIARSRGAGSGGGGADRPVGGGGDVHYHIGSVTKEALPDLKKLLSDHRRDLARQVDRQKKLEDRKVL